MNITDELERLGKLHNDGALSDAEFAQAKTKLLSQSGGDVPPTLDKPLTEAKFKRFLLMRAVIGLTSLVVFLLFVIHWLSSPSSPHKH